MSAAAGIAFSPVNASGISEPIRKSNREISKNKWILTGSCLVCSDTIEKAGTVFQLTCCKSKDTELIKGKQQEVNKPRFLHEDCYMGLIGVNDDKCPLCKRKITQLASGRDQVTGEDNGDANAAQEWSVDEAVEAIADQLKPRITAVFLDKACQDQFRAIVKHFKEEIATLDDLPEDLHEKTLETFLNTYFVHADERSLDESERDQILEAFRDDSAANSADNSDGENEDDFEVNAAEAHAAVVAAGADRKDHKDDRKAQPAANRGGINHAAAGAAAAADRKDEKRDRPDQADHKQQPAAGNPAQAPGLAVVLHGGAAARALHGRGDGQILAAGANELERPQQRAAQAAAAAANPQIALSPMAVRPLAADQRRAPMPQAAAHQAPQRPDGKQAEQKVNPRELSEREKQGMIKALKALPEDLDNEPFDNLEAAPRHSLTNFYALPEAQKITLMTEALQDNLPRGQELPQVAHTKLLHFNAAWENKIQAAVDSYLNEMDGQDRADIKLFVDAFLVVCKLQLGRSYLKHSLKFLENYLGRSIIIDDRRTEIVLEFHRQVHAIVAQAAAAAPVQIVVVHRQGQAAAPANAPAARPQAGEAPQQPRAAQAPMYLPPQAPAAAQHQVAAAAQLQGNVPAAAPANVPNAVVALAQNPQIALPSKMKIAAYTVVGLGVMYLYSKLNDTQRWYLSRPQYWF